MVLSRLDATWVTAREHPPSRLQMKHATEPSTVLTGPGCVRAMAHVLCRLFPGRGETPEGVSPSPSPPWGSTWAVSCGYATARPSVQRSPGAGVTADAQLSIRRGGA